MRDGERRHDRDERADPSERNDEAEQEQEVVRAVENVRESERDESHGGLVPPRIERNHAGVAFELERADRAARRQEAENRDRPDAEARKARVDGKSRPIRLNRIFEQNIEQALRPEKVGVVGQLRSGQMRNGFVIGGEGSIALQCGPNLSNGGYGSGWPSS